MLLAAIAVLLLPLSNVLALTASEVHRLQRSIEDTLKATTGLDEDGKRYEVLVGGFVRLAFHSCLGERCDGCINPEERVGNNGLQPSVEALEAIRSRSGVTVSRADLWALAAITAANRALKNAAAKRKRANDGDSGLRVRFRYGRKDCATSPRTTDSVRFPNPQASVDDLLEFLRAHFRLLPKLVVAVLGSHGLGVARRVGSSSPFANWVTCADCLDNTFFHDIMDGDLNWVQVPVQLDPSSKESVWIWRKGETMRRIKFNCDIALMKNISLTSTDTGKATCTYDSCPESTTAAWVRRYAADNALFLRDFATALQAVIEKGYDAGDLNDPEDISNAGDSSSSIPGDSNGRNGGADIRKSSSSAGASKGWG